MAVDYFSDDEEKDENEVTQPNAQLAGDQGIVTGNTPDQKAEGAPNSSGSFTNLQSYLDANKDQGFGREVAGKVQSTIGDANKAQSNAESEFKNTVDSSVVKKNDDLISRAVSTPQSVVNNESDYNEFVKMRDAKNTGPQSFVSAQDIYQPAAQQTEKAFETANSTKDAAGRKAYLNQEYGKNAGRYNYTKGQQKLDNLLIEKDPESYSEFQKNWEEGQKAKSNFNSLADTLDQYASTNAASNLETRRATRGAIGLNEDGTINDSSPIIAAKRAAEQRAKELNDKKRAEAAAFAAAQSNGRKYSAEQLAELGLSEGQQLFGFDPNTFRTEAADLDFNTAASPEEVAQAAALAKLAGVENTYLPYADKAGKYNAADFNTFDKNKIAQEIAGRKSAYENELNNTFETFAPTTFNEQGFRGDTSRIPLLQAIDLANSRAANAAEYLKQPGGAGSYRTFAPQIMQYQALVNKLKEIQNRRHAEDVVGGGQFASHYTKLPSYLDLLQGSDRTEYQ